MDYSSHYLEILIRYYMIFAFTIFFIIVFAIYGAKLIKQYTESKKFIKLLGAIALAGGIVVFSYFSVPHFKDIPNAINQNFVIITGTVVSGDSGGRAPETRGFTVIDDNGNRRSVLANYMPIFTGDRFEIILMPNTGSGVILRKLESE